MKALETISDLAALARAGFKAEDIKSIIANQPESQAEAERPTETPAKESGQPATENAEASDKEEKLDYKSMYEGLKAELEETKKNQVKLSEDLKAAQDLNTSKSLENPETLTDQEKVNNMLLSLL